MIGSARSDGERIGVGGVEGLERGANVLVRMQHRRWGMGDGGDPAAVVVVLERQRVRFGDLDQPLVEPVCADRDDDISAADRVGFAERPD